MSFTLIESKTLGTAAASIEFTSIPQDGTDLYFLFALRNSNTGAGDTAISLRFNGSTTSRTNRVLYGDGSSASSFAEDALNAYGLVNNGMTANTFCNGSIYVPNYTAARNKSASIDLVGENNATRSDSSIVAALWSNTSAITSLTIASLSSFTFTANSTISLYKITKGSDGIVTTS